VEYSREVLTRQRGQVSAEEMRTMMREEVQGAVGDVVLVLDTIVSSHVGPLREDLRGLRSSVEGLRGGLEEVRVSLSGAGGEEGLLQLLCASNEAGLVEFKELWAKRMANLETLVLSPKGDEALILREMRKIELAVSSHLADLDVSPDRVVGELSKLRETIVSLREMMGELFEELKQVVEGT
jgi:hypothetical protein